MQNIWYTTILSLETEASVSTDRLIRTPSPSSHPTINHELTQ